jgi:aldose 1-epimerase
MDNCIPIKGILPSHFLALILTLVSLCLSAQAAVKTEQWGKTPEGTTVRLFTLTDETLCVRLTEYGARIVSLEAPDKYGHTADIVLGYSNLEQYLNDPKDFFGSIVGRFGNRIAKGTFALDGKTYHVPLNNNGNALHGGTHGFSSKVWQGRAINGNAVEFSLVSPDGDMGFPGTLTVHVRYTLLENKLRIDYSSETDKTTIINLTNHTYFNLAGESSGDILSQQLQIEADGFTPVDSTLIPTGAVVPLHGTPLDFRRLTAIGSRIDVDNEQLHIAGGYDHNFVLKGAIDTLRKVAFALDPMSGRTLTVLTTEPGVQFYSGNFLNGAMKGYSGRLYEKHAGFCLETQHFPDSPNRPNFPSTVLHPGKSRSSVTVFIFGINLVEHDVRTSKSSY